MKRSKKINVLQAAKVLGIIYFLIACVIMIPVLGFVMLFESSIFPMPFGSGIMVLAMPFVYGIASFIMTAVVCLVYNLISEYTGGIEIELETAGDGYID